MWVEAGILSTLTIIQEIGREEEVEEDSKSVHYLTTQVNTGKLQINKDLTMSIGLAISKLLDLDSLTSHILIGNSTTIGIVSINPISHLLNTIIELARN